MSWKRDLTVGDEIRIKNFPTPVVISTIEWIGNVARITDTHGERYECRESEIK